VKRPRSVPAIEAHDEAGAGAPAWRDDGAPGLYVHIPFCSAICPYCDFSVLTGGRERQATFVDHLEAEIETWARPSGELFQAPFDTVYLGGGTPSSLAPWELERILAALARHLSLDPEPWIHMEVNPEDVTADSLAAWRRLGVRTLSLGAQSFDAQNLRFLGRRHTPARGQQAVEMGLEAGFHTVSLDLIFGLPGQDAESWARDLQEAVRLGPHHISCYQLTVHAGTPFGFRRDRGQLSELPEEIQAELFLATHERLESVGYAAYEVSNFALAPEHHSRHNIKYWQHVPYLGIGPSAHSFVGHRRWWNERKIGPYQRRLAHGELPVAGHETLGPGELALEHLMLGLRTLRGIDLRDIGRRCDLDLETANQALVTELLAGGLLISSGSRLQPTRRGMAMADALAGAFAIPARHEPHLARAAPPHPLPLLT
jgi:putative oxygen-independent coproporphyrinogen III oxidase